MIFKSFLNFRSLTFLTLLTINTLVANVGATCFNKYLKRVQPCFPASYDVLTTRIELNVSNYCQHTRPVCIRRGSDSDSGSASSNQCPICRQPVAHLTDSRPDTVWIPDVSSSELNISFDIGKAFHLGFISLKFAEPPHSLNSLRIFFKKKLNSARRPQARKQQETWSESFLMLTNCSGKLAGNNRSRQSNRFIIHRKKTVQCHRITDNAFYFNMDPRFISQQLLQIRLQFNVKVAEPRLHTNQNKIFKLRAIQNLIRFYGRSAVKNDHIYSLLGLNQLSRQQQRPQQKQQASKLPPSNTGKSSSSGRQSLSSPQPLIFSEITMVGQCECHGHAAQCTLTGNATRQRRVCKCQHNTAGSSCESCLPLYNDQPWQPNRPCKKCQCNLHSDQCKFSSNLYARSANQSGGICQNCRHNTRGRNCHLCQHGFYQDWTKPSSHPNLCKKCFCSGRGVNQHRICAHRTGACICRPNYTGKNCQRCKIGYYRGRTGNCVKYRLNKEKMQNAPSFQGATATAANQRAGRCKVYCSFENKRIRIRKYCSKDAVFLVKFLRGKNFRHRTRLEFRIFKILRLNRRKDKRMRLGFSTASKQGSRRRDDDDSGIRAVWINRRKYVNCNCPSIHFNRPYLVMLKFRRKSIIRVRSKLARQRQALHTSVSNKTSLKLNGARRRYRRSSLKLVSYRNELALRRSDVVLRWNSRYMRRFHRFNSLRKRGFCRQTIKRYRRFYHLYNKNL